jgi:alkylresorcinol/alkylpyrone synthase
VARIISTAKALAPNDVSQDQALEFARLHFNSKFSDIDRLLKIFTTSRIEHRQFCVPMEWFYSSKSFQEKNEAYIEWACKLGETACRRCLDNAAVSPDEIDRIIFVSTTGLATPSIDARLINIMPFRSDISRVPVWGLGCVGGAVGLSMANDFIKAYPGSKVLLVVTELCGLTFQFGDLGKSNLVATALFADGAAAVLLGLDGPGPEIIAAQSTTWPDSLDIMGWNVLNEGLQVVFARAIPSIVNKYARTNIADFISKYDLTLDDLDYFLFHPGGAKVLDAYKEALCLSSDEIQLSEDVLRNHGNMSAVTILYVLDNFINSGPKQVGTYGIMSALGPGFSSESLLFKI